MSQGRKDPPEPQLFLSAQDVYAHLPRDPFYARLNEWLDLEFVRDLTFPLYKSGGRPSLDPVVFFKCMFIGFFENIIYDTQLELRIADSLTLRKFLGYSLEERTPDESTLRKTRQWLPEEAFQLVFEQVLDQCQDAGLLKGRVLGLDSTQVDANASMDSLRHKTLQCTYEQYILALRQQDAPTAGVAEAKRADRKRSGKASNTIWESATDPDARVMMHSDGHTHLSFRVDATVDLESGVITNAGATFADVSDQTDFMARVDEAEATLAARALTLAAVVSDKGHHSGPNLAAMEERAVIGLISSPRTERGQPGFQRVDFAYDAATDTFRCPAGKELRRAALKEQTVQQYRARAQDCQTCPHWGVCTQSKSGRTLRISIYEDLIQANRARVRSEEARPLMMIRRQRGEAPFGYFKQFGGLRRFMGRGLDYAQKKTLMAAAGFNLIKLLRAQAAQAQAASGGSTPGTSGTSAGPNPVFWGLKWPQKPFRGPLKALLRVLATPQLPNRISYARPPVLRQPGSCFARNARLSGGC